MATSGIVKTTAYDSRYIEFAWSRTSYSTTNNTSTISWTLTARGSGNYSKYLAAPFQVKIDGAQVYYSDTRVTTTDGYKIASGTHTFTHNADGSKSFSVSVNAAIYYKAYNCSGSGSFTLDNIPRAAKLTSFVWDNDEQNPVITYENPAGNGVTSLELSLYGNRENKIATRTLSKAGSSYTFVLTDAERALVWGYYNKNKTTKISFSMELVTTIGTTKLAHALTRLDMPMINYAPSINSVSVTALDDYQQYTGAATRYIKNASDIKYSVSAAANKGAAITSYKITCGSYTGTSKDATITNVNGNSIVCTITDTRGSVVNKTVQLEVVDYIAPTCEESAKIEMDGETTAKATITVQGDYFNNSFGAANNQLFVQIKTNVDNEWITYSNLITPTLNGNRYSLVVTIYDLPYREEFKYQCKTLDLISATAATPEQTLNLYPVFDWSNTDFNFNVPISFNGVQMQDYIVEQGTRNSWNYRKWSSGTMECWRRLQVTANVTSAWGSLYTSGALTATNLTYPYAFTETPILNVTLASFGSGGIIMASGNNYGSATATGALEIARGTSYSGGQYLLNYYAIGRYK